VHQRETLHALRALRMAAQRQGEATAASWSALQDHLLEFTRICNFSLLNSRKKEDVG